MFGRTLSLSNSFLEALSSRNTGPKTGAGAGGAEGGRGRHGKQFENQSFDPLVLEKSFYCLLCYLLSILERSVLRNKDFFYVAYS